MAKTFHIKKPGIVNGSAGWVKVCDCKDQNELKNKLQELMANYARSKVALDFLAPLGPVTPGNVIRADLLRVYEGASWRGIAWLKRNNICL